MKRKNVLFLVVSLFALLVAGDAVESDVVASDVKSMDPVAVNAISNPQEFNIKGIQKSLKRFGDIPASSRDKVKLSFYIEEREGRVLDTSALDLALVDGDAVALLTIAVTNEVLFPVEVSHLSGNASIVSNAPKKSFAIVYKVDLSPKSAGETTIGYLRDALSQARSAWKKQYGIGALLVPKFTCVNFKFRAPEHVSVVTGSPGTEATIWTSKASVDVKVPVFDVSMPAEAFVRWNKEATLRMAACKAGPRDE